ncbi:MAG: glycosyltransferase family 4 protein [Patescibacteria group bacterium]
MTRPRILIFSLAYLPFIGGAEVAVKEITDRLPEFDFEIVSADVRNFWSKYFYPIWAYRRAARQHQTKNYDLVWAIMANQAGMAAALFKRRFPSVPFLLTLQEGDDLNSWAYRLRLWGPRLFRVFQLADRIQVISNYLGAWAQAMGAKCPITVIPNGVDMRSFQLLGSSFQEKRKEKIIIHTGRLVKKNGVDILIEAMRFLPENIKLQILGTGQEEMSLKQLMSRFNLDSRVEFLGQVLPNKVVEYLTQALIFVRPSRSEGLGNSFLEAMAAGLPVVGTAVGGIPDFLKQGQTGWICEVNNSQDVAEKIKFILDPNNESLVSQVVARARQMVLDKYNWDTIARAMSHLLNP